MLAVPRTEGQATVCCTFPATYLPPSLPSLLSAASLYDLFTGTFNKLSTRTLKPPHSNSIKILHTSRNWQQFQAIFNYK